VARPMRRRKSLWAKTPEPPPRCLVIPLPERPTRVTSEPAGRARSEEFPRVRHATAAIGGSPAESAESRETRRAVHPMGETAKRRTRLPAVLCSHCLQDPSFFLNGAQKLAGGIHGALFAASSIAIGGAEIASAPCRKWCR
jgi:hypothetical protein